MTNESHPVIIPQHVPVPVRNWQVCFSSAFVSSIFIFMFTVRFSFLHLTLHFVNRVLMWTRPVKRMQQNCLVPTHPLFPATLAVSILIR